MFSFVSDPLMMLKVILILNQTDLLSFWKALQSSLSLPLFRADMKLNLSSDAPQIAMPSDLFHLHPSGEKRQQETTQARGEMVEMVIMNVFDVQSKGGSMKGTKGR